MTKATFIKEGDRVRIYMNAESRMWPAVRDYTWTVTSRPATIGLDNWVFSCGNETIEINPMSAHFDGLKLITEVTDGR